MNQIFKTIVFIPKVGYAFFSPIVSKLMERREKQTQNDKNYKENVYKSKKRKKTNKTKKRKIKRKNKTKKKVKNYK